MQKISSKLLNWASVIDPKTLNQAVVTSKMPFVSPHMALMPDAHLGKGATVGSVIPTEGAIIPAAVGVDIGCGMIAVKTQYTLDDVNTVVSDGKSLSDLRIAIENAIPLSAGGYNVKTATTAKKRIEMLEKEADDRLAFYDKLCKVSWRLQLGSLGSGNHFIEITIDERNNVWLFLHSGSRGIGNQVGQYHIRQAKEFCTRPFVQKSFGKLPDPDLAYLMEGTPEFNVYMEDLNWCQHFALLNREEMMDRVKAEFEKYMGNVVVELQRINCHHNFTQKESHCLTCIDNLDSGNLIPEFHTVEKLSKVRDFLVDYRPVVHSCGGLVLFSAQGDRVASPLQEDVLTRTLRYSDAGGRALTLECNLVELPIDRLCSCRISHQPIASYEHNFVHKLKEFYPDAFDKSFRRLDKWLVQFFFDTSLPSQSDYSISCNDKHEKVELWMSRKGAISAQEGEYGLIPGSMGDASYVVTGKGNKAAFCSSPHGAGRVYSRGLAKSTFTIEQLRESMKGIEYRDTEAFLDEIPAAYKRIDTVMEDSKDLVEIVHTFHQIVNVKGD
jgi:RNA-splicing ligase RtcB